MNTQKIDSTNSQPPPVYIKKRTEQAAEYLLQITDYYLPETKFEYETFHALCEVLDVPVDQIITTGLSYSDILELHQGGYDILFDQAKWIMEGPDYATNLNHYYGVKY